MYELNSNNKKVIIRNLLLSIKWFILTVKSFVLRSPSTPSPVRTPYRHNPSITGVENNLLELLYQVSSVTKAMASLSFPTRTHTDTHKQTDRRTNYTLSTSARLHARRWLAVKSLIALQCHNQSSTNNNNVVHCACVPLRFSISARPGAAWQGIVWPCRDLAVWDSWRHLAGVKLVPLTSVTCHGVTCC